MVPVRMGGDDEVEVLRQPRRAAVVDVDAEAGRGRLDDVAHVVHMPEDHLAFRYDLFRDFAQHLVERLFVEVEDRPSGVVADHLGFVERVEAGIVGHVVGVGDAVRAVLRQAHEVEAAGIVGLEYRGLVELGRLGLEIGQRGGNARQIEDFARLAAMETPSLAAAEESDHDEVRPLLDGNVEEVVLDRHREGDLVARLHRVVDRPSVGDAFEEPVGAAPDLHHAVARRFEGVHEDRDALEGRWRVVGHLKGVVGVEPDLPALNAPERLGDVPERFQVDVFHLGLDEQRPVRAQREGEPGVAHRGGGDEDDDPDADRDPHVVHDAVSVHGRGLD